jgi:hypothetical protein
VAKRVKLGFRTDRVTPNIVQYYVSPGVNLKPETQLVMNDTTLLVSKGAGCRDTLQGKGEWNSSMQRCVEEWGARSSRAPGEKLRWQRTRDRWGFGSNSTLGKFCYVGTQTTKIHWLSRRFYKMPYRNMGIGATLFGQSSGLWSSKTCLDTSLVTNEISL